MPNIFDGVEGLRGGLDYHLERANVLLSNVAHVDTPGYVPRDLAREPNMETFGTALSTALERTNPGHLEGENAPVVRAGRIFEDPSPGAGNDRNYVSLDREAAKVAANSVRYDVVSTLVASELSGLSYAAGDGKG